MAMKMKNRTASRLLSMTPEEWYDCSKPTYKRHKGDTPFVCPYCGKDTHMTSDRYLAFYHARKRGDVPKTICFDCGKEFYFMNYNAEYCRKNKTRATWKKEEYGDLTFLRRHP